MAAHQQFPNSQWSVEYRSACTEPMDSLRPVMVEYAILSCNEALKEILSSVERMAIYTALGDLAVLRLTYHRQERLNRPVAD
jgi:hypothetical protein